MIKKLLNKIKEFIREIREDYDSWAERNQEDREKFYYSLSFDIFRFLDKP